MLDSLTAVREDSMRRLTETCSDESVIVFETESESDHSGIASDISRRLHPERQAINTEELKVLVDDDELGKRVYDEASADSGDISDLGAMQTVKQ